MYRNNNKIAFTLVEALITLLILAVVSILCLSIVNNIEPNENILNAHKAFNTVSKTVQMLTNDSDSYVDGTFTSFPSSVADGDKDEYFCEQFAAQLNLKTDVTCSGITTNDVSSTLGTSIDSACGSDYTWSSDNKYTKSNTQLNKQDSAFVTIDGIGWYGLYGEFDGDKYKIICINVAPDDANIPAFGVGVNKYGRIVPGEIIKHCLDEKTAEQNSEICPL